MKSSVRLPDHIRPERYKLTLKPDLENFTFEGEEVIYLTLVQQKARTLGEATRDLLAKGQTDEIPRIRQTFIELNQQMWERGVFDSDTAWEENYDLLPNGKLVVIDIGGLLDDPNQFPFNEGVPRIYQYEADIRDNFTTENFRKFFGKKPHTRERSPNSLKSLSSRPRLTVTAIKSMSARDNKHDLQLLRQIQAEDQEWD